MQSLVSQRLNEGNSGPIFYPIAEITAALNEANRFFVLLSLGLETTQPWTVQPATAFFHMLQVFPDWICPLRITDSTGRKIRPSRVEELVSLDSTWVASPGQPVRYAALGADVVGLYQQPAGVGTILQVTYCRAPLALVATTDTPEIPNEYHPRLVDYAIYRMRQVEGGQEFQKAMPYLDRFLDGAQHYGAYVRARNIGSRYDKTPIELEKYDRSQLLGFRPTKVPARKPDAQA